MEKTLTPLDNVTEMHVNHAGSEYLRGLWERHEATMNAPFTVSEGELVREDEDGRTPPRGTAADPV